MGLLEPTYNTLVVLYDYNIIQLTCIWY